MDTRLRRSLYLLFLLVLAVAVAWSLPYAATAHSLFQSSVPTIFTDTPVPIEAPTDTPEPTATSEFEATATATTDIESTATWTLTASPATSGVPTESGAALATPPAAAVTPIDGIGTPSMVTTPVPVETEIQPTVSMEGAQVTGSERPTPLGYLPAPTLTSPDAAAPSLGSGLLPGSQPPLSAPAEAPPVATAQDTAPGASVPSAARLIDNGIVALSYLWLCCGAFVLVVAVLGIVFLARRKRSK